MKTSAPALRIALTLTLGLCAAGPAAAQSTPNEKARTEARVHMGPLYVNPELHVREIGVDTNVFNTGLAPQSDFTFTVGPEADIWVPVGRRGLFKTTAGADLVYYQKFSSERSIDPHWRVRGETYLQRVTLFVENDLIHTRQRPNYEIDVRARRLENTFRAGTEVRFSPKFGVEVAARQSVVNFDGAAVFSGSNLEEALNRETRGVSATARYRRTTLTTIVVRTEVSQDRFAYSPLRNADTIRVEPGVEFSQRALISGSGYLGVRKLTPVHLELPEFQGLIGSGRLRFRLPGATALEFAGDRDLAYSYERLQPYFVFDGLGVTLRRQLVSKFDVSVGGHRQKYSYRDLVLFPRVNNGEGRTDFTRIFTFSVGYTLNRDMRVGVGVSRQARTSNSNFLTPYEGFRFGTSVTYGL